MIYGLTEETIEQISSILRQCPKIEEAVLYGSRAKGTFKPASDIDLTLKGEKLTIAMLNAISWKLDDLLLPYTFDLSLYKHIKNEALRNHIERIGKTLYKKELDISI